MDLGQLRYFNKIVKHRSFTRAAQACSVSQPALSQQIAKLEKELGQPLFERHGRVIKLTRAGQILQMKVDKILGLVDDAKRQIMDDGENGRIVISAVPTIAPYLFTRILQELASQFPSTMIECYEDPCSDLLQRCEGGEVDIGLMSVPTSPKGVTFEPLFTEELCLALPTKHALVEKLKITGRDLVAERFVLLNKSDCLADAIEGVFAAYDFQPRVAARVEHLETLKTIVRAGHGIALIPRMAADPDPSAGIIYRSLSGSRPMRKIGLVYNPHRFQSRLITNFLKGLRELLDNGTIDWYTADSQQQQNQLNPSSDSSLLQPLESSPYSDLN
jgi:LysR family transcriptional regulator, hydrogen peroxide-inducible genes activator